MRKYEMEPRNTRDTRKGSLSVLLSIISLFFQQEIHTCVVTSGSISNSYGLANTPRIALVFSRCGSVAPSLSVDAGIPRSLYPAPKPLNHGYTRIDTDMFGLNQRPPMPRFAATYLSFFAAKSVCIGVYPWLNTRSVAAPLLQVFRVFRGQEHEELW